MISMFSTAVLTNELHSLCYRWLRLRSIGKFGFRSSIEIRISYFAIEHEIRKRVGFQCQICWISFPFYCEIRKSICKTVLVNSGVLFLVMRARARPLFLRKIFQILFLVSQSNGKNENPKTDISAWSQRWNPVSDYSHITQELEPWTAVSPSGIISTKSVAVRPLDTKGRQWCMSASSAI